MLFSHFGAISSQLRLVVYLDKCKDFESKLPNDTSNNLNAWLSKTCRVQDIAADMPVTKECKDRTNNEDAQRICMNLSDVWSIDEHCRYFGSEFKRFPHYRVVFQNAGSGTVHFSGFSLKSWTHPCPVLPRDSKAQQ